MPGKAESYWIDSTPDTSYPMMKEDLKVDVAVLGGGIAGITTAVLLKRAGMKVAVVEAERIAKGVTAYTTSHTSTAQSYYYKDLADRFGGEKAAMCAESCQNSIDMIGKLSKEYGIDCDYMRTDMYVFAPERGEHDRLKEEMDVEKRLGVPVTYVDRAPLPFDTFGALRYSNQAKFHPRKYLLGLAEVVNGDGSFVFENTQATDVHDGEPCKVKTSGGTITARDVVVATHFPFPMKGLIFARMKPYRSYVLAMKADDEISDDMFYSTEQPCHYIRNHPTPDGQLLIVGGEDHAVGHVTDTIERYKRLEKYCRERFKIKSIEYSWSTQDNYTFDSVPFIGKISPESKHEYVATGFKGTGMTYGTVSAMILADLILDRPNRWASLYDPVRIKPQEIKEGLGAQLHIGKTFVEDRLKNRRTSPRSRMARQVLRWSAAKRHAFTGTKMEKSTRCLPPANIWDATLSGTTPRSPGIVRATDRGTIIRVS